MMMRIKIFGKENQNNRYPHTASKIFLRNRLRKKNVSDGSQTNRTALPAGTRLRVQNEVFHDFVIVIP
jgi:hypothetical protein